MIVSACFVPHPPIIVSCVGRGRERDAAATVAAMQQVSQWMMASKPEVLFVLSPHAGHSQTGLPIFKAETYRGSFARFGVREPQWTFSGEVSLQQSLLAEPIDRGAWEPHEGGLLDHGALVPLSYMAEAGFAGAMVLVGMPYMPGDTVATLGHGVAKIFRASPKRVGVIISGDLSHCLTPEAPNGYSPYGKQYDDAFVALMKVWDTAGLLRFDQALAQRGAQDSLWPAQFLVGLLRDFKVRPRFLSYEGPFGVGYLVEAFEIT